MVSRTTAPGTLEPVDVAPHEAGHRALHKAAINCWRMTAQGNAPMTKSELIRRLTDKLLHLPANDVESAVNTLVENLSNTLAAGERIEVRGFGSFSKRYRPERLGRNPRTGDPADLAARYAIYFKPGRELRERVNDARRVGLDSAPHASRN